MASEKSLVTVSEISRGEERFSVEILDSRVFMGGTNGPRVSGGL